jgi:PAS domain S-box-containing protein
VEYVSTPIIEKGAVAGAVVVFRDITERLEAERAVEESQERFLQLAEHIREVFWITDPAKTSVLYISPGYEEVWGHSCESLYAMPGSWMEAIHPDDRLRVRDAAMRRQFPDRTMRNIASSARMDRCDGSGIAHSRS